MPSQSFTPINGLSLIAACHSGMPHDRWAGPPRNKGAGAPTPGAKTSRGWAGSGTEFAAPAPVHKLHSGASTSGWSPTSTTSTSNNSRKRVNIRVKGNAGLCKSSRSQADATGAGAH